MKKTNLLFLVDGFNQGGAEHQLYELIRGIDKTRYTVRIITWYPSTFFLDLRTMPGVEWIEAIRKSKFDFGVLFRAFALIRKGKVDILHAYLDSACFYGGVCKFFFKRLIFIATERSSFKNLTRLQRIHKPISHRLADLTIANSQAGANYLETLGVSGESIRVIRNGINTNRFSNTPESDKIELPKEISPTKNLRRILCVGRITRLKNQLSIVKAFNESAVKKDFALIFIGKPEPEYTALVKHLIKEQRLEERVYVVNESEDIAAYYHYADLVVLFSDFEGTPNAILEAMASGKTVVTSEVGDVSHYVDNTFGWIVRPRDTEGLIHVFNIVEGLSAGNLKHRGELAYKKFKALRCDTSRMVKSHESVYGELISRRING